MEEQETVADSATNEVSDNTEHQKPLSKRQLKLQKHREEWLTRKAERR